MPALGSLHRVGFEHRYERIDKLGSTFRRATVSVAIFLAGWAMCSAAAAYAQGVVNINDSTSTPQPGSGHDYIHLLNETVNPVTGSLSLRIDIPLPKGRGLSIPFSVGYDSNGLGVATQSSSGSLYPVVIGTGSGRGPCGSDSGWRYAFPCLSAQSTQLNEQITGNTTQTENCGWIDSYVFYDPYGTPHALHMLLSQTTQDTQNMCPWATGTTVAGADSQVVATTTNVNSDTQGGNSARIADADGTVYIFPSFNDFTGTSDNESYQGTGYYETVNNAYTTFATIPTMIEDRNGNQITINSGNYTDTLGRPLLSLSGSGITGNATTATDTFTITGLSSPAYKVNWVSKVGLGYVGNSYSLTYTNAPNSNSNCQGRFGKFYPVTPSDYITSIVLPNADQYSFTYDPTYGTLNSVTYPGGLKVSYDWAVIPSLLQQEFSTSYWDVVGTQGASTFCQYDVDTVGIVGRHVSQNYNEILTQAFGYTKAATFGGITTTAVTTFDHVAKTANITTTTYTKDIVHPNQFVPHPQMQGDQYFLYPCGDLQCNGFYSLESVETVQDCGPATSIPTSASSCGGPVLETVFKNWYTAATSNAVDLLQSVATTVGTTGPTSAIAYCYGVYGGVVTEKDEFDYGISNNPATFQVPSTSGNCAGGSIAPARKTVTTYQPFATTSLYPSVQWNASVGPIFDRPANVVTYSGTNTYNGTTTKIAETDYLYAPTTTTSVSATQHDETVYGASATVSRGNATMVTHNCFFGAYTCQPLVATYAYDETGQVAAVTDGRNYTTHYKYTDSPSGGNAAGNSNAYLTTITLPTSATETFVYNYPTGELASLTDENNRPTTYSYNDPLLRLTDRYDPPSADNNNATPHTHWSYTDGSSRSMTTVNPIGVTAIESFDGLGHVTQTQLTTDPAGTDIVQSVYDGNARLYSTTNPYRGSLPASTTKYFHYDALNRPSETDNQDGSKQLWCYNGVHPAPLTTGLCNLFLGTNSTTPGSVTGTWVDSFDENNNHWQHASDAFGRSTQVLEPNGTSSGPMMETDYGYNQLGDLLSVMQWGGAHGAAGARSRSFAYNSLSQLMTSINPETGTICYGVWSGGNCINGYDANGNIQSKIDARGITMSYSYDGLNRLLTKTGPGINYNYAYDSASTGPNQNTVGRLASSSNAVNADEVYSYDEMGRLRWQASWTPSSPNNTSITTSATYDPAGNTKYLAYPNGTQIQQAWDTAGHLCNVLNATAGTPTCSTTSSYQYLASPSYLPNGSLQSATFGNGVTESYSLNNRLQPTEIAVQKSGGAKYMDKQYCYGPATSLCQSFPANDNGNILAVLNAINSSRSQIYSYDGLNRIAGFSNIGRTMAQTFSIDGFGNMSVTGGTLGPMNLTFTSNNQINLINGYGYDLSGNATEMPLPFSGSQYNYDSESKLVSLGSTTSPSASYTYDANGARMRKDSLGSWTEYISFGGIPIAEKYSSGLWADYIFANGQRIARSDTSIHYYSADHLGTTTIVTDSQGDLANDSDYYPYGAEYSITDADSNHYKFTGKERDTESGNDYFGARYYASTMGRFMSPDFNGSDDGPPDAVPYADFTNPQSLNLYGYVQNNPLKFTDPDGHDCVVQTRTSNTTETVSVSTGNCDKVNVGDGQTKTYIAGTVDTNSIKGDGSGGITLGYTPYAGGGDSGAADLKGAPIPDSTNLAYGWGNNAQGYQKLSTANQAVGTLKGIGIFYGASAVGALGVLAAPALPEVGQQAVAFLESRGMPATAALAKVLWALSKAGQNNPPIGTILKELGGRLAQEYKQQHPN